MAFELTNGLDILDELIYKSKIGFKLSFLLNSKGLLFDYDDDDDDDGSGRQKRKCIKLPFPKLVHVIFNIDNKLSNPIKLTFWTFDKIPKSIPILYIGFNNCLIPQQNEITNNKFSPPSYDYIKSPNIDKWIPSENFEPPIGLCHPPWHYKRFIPISTMIEEEPFVKRDDWIHPFNDPHWKPRRRNERFNHKKKYRKRYNDDFHSYENYNVYNLDFIPYNEQQELSIEKNEFKYYTRQEIWDLKYAKYNQSHKYKR